MKPREAVLAAAVCCLFLVIVVGAYVTVAGFGDACGSSIPADWPGCQGGLFPPLQLGPVMEYLHRVLAAFSTLFLLLAAAMFWRSPEAGRQARLTLLAACGLLVAQVVLGGVVIAQVEASALVAAHQGLAVLTFGLAVAAFVKRA